jgi:hypothetical protein
MTHNPRSAPSGMTRWQDLAPIPDSPLNAAAQAAARDAPKAAVPR